VAVGVAHALDYLESFRSKKRYNFRQHNGNVFQSKNLSTNIDLKK